MIQLNLLPDVKLEYIKANRSRRLFISISILVALVAIGILVLTLSVDALQKKHLSDLNKDINNESSQLKNEPQINKILTVQNQLESLTTLHAAKPAAARLFTYLNEITPANVNISSFNIDFTAYTATVTGGADSLSTINQYVDTLKHATYQATGSTSSSLAFSNVVLGSFGLSTSAKDPSQAASYTITLSYDKSIFDITQGINDLTIPKEVTTRSQLDQPTDLFKAAPAPPPSSTGSTTTGGSN